MNITKNLLKTKLARRIANLLFCGFLLSVHNAFVIAANSSSDSNQVKAHSATTKSSFVWVSARNLLFYDVHVIILDWRTNTKQKINSFEVYRSTKPTPTPNKDTLVYQQKYNEGPASFVDLKIEPSTTYYYRVFLRTEKGHVFHSEVAKVVTPKFVKPKPKPVKLSLSDSLFNERRNHKEVALEWTGYPSIDFIKYEVFRSLSQNVQPTSKNLIKTLYDTNDDEHFYKECGYRDHNLQPETTYYYKIGVHSETQGLFLSNELKYTTAKRPSPTKIAIPTLEMIKPATFSRVEVQWSSDYAADFERYELHRSTNYNFVPSTKTLIHKLEYFERADITFYTDEQLKPGTTYYYRLKTIHENGNSATSKVMAVRTLTQKPKPLILSLAGQPMQKSVRLKWTQQSSIDFVKYDLFCDERKDLLASDGPYNDIFEANANTYTIEDLEPNKTYYFQVFFYGPNEKPIKSNILVVKTPK